MKKNRKPVLADALPGLPLVHKHLPGAASAIFGVAVRAGSADEPERTHGLAHFVEHTIFKGTARRSAWHIINRMEAVGGELNAYTTKEATVIYTIFPAQYAARAVELVADLALNSRFPAAQLEKEREVVVDEIKSYLDSPADAIFDDFDDLIFAGNPLGHNILGDTASVRRLGSDDCRRFLERHYRRGNMTAFYSGPRPAQAMAALVARYFEALPEADNAGRTPLPAPLPPRPFDVVRKLPLHQCHTLTGAVCPGLGDPARVPWSLFANIIGGPGMNSVLNVELRERRGLVYTVEASPAFYSTCGLLSVYFGCDADDYELCRRLCRDTFLRLADSGLSPRALAAAKKQYLGQCAIARENNENHILAAARSVLFRGRLTDDDDVTTAVQAVTPDDISAIAATMLSASTLTFRR